MIILALFSLFFSSCSSDEQLDWHSKDHASKSTEAVLFVFVQLISVPLVATSQAFINIEGIIEKSQALMVRKRRPGGGVGPESCALRAEAPYPKSQAGMGIVKWEMFF